MATSCDLCNQIPLKTKKDKLIYENLEYYIVENGNQHLRINGGLIFAKRRISLTLKEHKGKINKTQLRKLINILIRFLESQNLTHGIDFFILKTGTTYPDHFHIHAYVLPLSHENILF